METTTKSAHTAGPWSHEREYVSRQRKQVTGNFLVGPLGGAAVAQVTGEHGGAEANARLIAAAPELLKFVAEVARCGYSVNRDHIENITDEARTLLARINVTE